ncbi:hypothetical protein [Actinokineospora sp. HUAS TT18]|uniref:hypothetical protein n=1 Tax=Actinokineospora sp. HUAS TT18 TaxID=3447451 RepID=UPI003F525CF4
MGSSRSRFLALTGAVGTAVSAVSLVLIANPPAREAQCLRELRSPAVEVIGAPFTDATQVSWRVPAGCPDIDITFDGETTADPSVEVRGRTTTAHTLAARIKDADGVVRTRVLATPVTVGGTVIEYESADGQWTPRPTNAEHPLAETADGFVNRLSAAARANLVGVSIELHIVPAGTAITELPPWRATPIPAGTVPACSSVTYEDKRVAIPIAAATGQQSAATARDLARELSCVALGSSSPAFASEVAAAWARRPSVASSREAIATSPDPLRYWCEGALILLGHPEPGIESPPRDSAWLSRQYPDLFRRLQAVFHA